ncbi:MAG: alpha-amylase [Tenericutes bacterium HGW-Tenericutes-1]|jgi:glycosidase|nr:MAG: alpha-amylase [Tenericutes bacterium HGW-Tenericutes-1]
MNKTPIKLRNTTIYQVFVRNHTSEGTFNSLIKDLDRIKDLGVDILYLLPIHPIGEKNRKGLLGSPYSIKNYREINPELGTIDDFINLINESHERNMKLIIDVVYNHTSRDSHLLKTHPEWFYKDKNGQFNNRVGEWWDITDFDFTKDKNLWIELADTLKYYASLGVDGFRCDVASLVPIDFWKYARKEVSKINRKAIWISESVHGGFVKYIRDLGFDAWSESEIYQVFDMAYDYDAQPYYEGYLKGQRPLKDYLEAIARQEEIYPGNYVKMKNLENHDFDRVASYVKNDYFKILNWFGFSFFQKGAFMLYAGGEYSSDHRPDLFEKDLFRRSTDITEYLKKLIKIKKRNVFSSGIYTVNIPEIDGVAYNSFDNEQEAWHGIFNVGQVDGSIKVKLEDGFYRNQLTGKMVKVQNGSIDLSRDPIAIRIMK